MYLHQIMEMNNEAAACIVQKEYAQGIEKLIFGVRQLQTHLVEMSELLDGNSADIHSDSPLDSWMYPAMEAIHSDSDASFFVYRRPLVVSPLDIGRARVQAENMKFYHQYVTGGNVNLVVAMLFNYGLACHLSHIDFEGRLNDGSRPDYDLLQRASQMYDLAITNLRRLAVPKSTERGSVVSDNIQFFRAAMNNLAIAEQTRYVMAASPIVGIPSNKGFERLRELLLRHPPASDDAPETTLWNCYLSNILRVTNSFQPNYCAAAC
ncbi:unnamed protein product [Cylindrotheca closterium]|uniref:Uncharacterized protein n=1 Tax=Cylindrotheca closterium TaxID=2856 RepID=A0AAD2FHI0_9STRA|nr:unnamed protein product [Cylindrotheca closterium]